MRAAVLDDRLEAIAGKPAGMLLTPNTYANMSGFGALGGRMLYVAYEWLAAASSYPIIAQLGTIAGNGIIRVQQRPNLPSDVRFDTAGGSQNLALNSIDTGAPGRFVAAAWVDDGMTAAHVMTSTGMQSIGMIPGTGMDDAPTLNLASATATATPLAAVAYRGVHAAGTRQRIVAWLARRYQALPPPRFLVTFALAALVGLWQREGHRCGWSAPRPSARSSDRQLSSAGPRRNRRDVGRCLPDDTGSHHGHAADGRHNALLRGGTQFDGHLLVHDWRCRRVFGPGVGGSGSAGTDRQCGCSGQRGADDLRRGIRHDRGGAGQPACSVAAGAGRPRPPVGSRALTSRDERRGAVPLRRARAAVHASLTQAVAA